MQIACNEIIEIRDPLISSWRAFKVNSDGLESGMCQEYTEHQQNY